MSTGWLIFSKWVEISTRYKSVPLVRRRSFNKTKIHKVSSHPPDSEVSAGTSHVLGVALQGKVEAEQPC